MSDNNMDVEPPTEPVQGVAPESSSTEVLTVQASNTQETASEYDQHSTSGDATTPSNVAMKVETLSGSTEENTGSPEATSSSVHSVTPGASPPSTTPATSTQPNEAGNIAIVKMEVETSSTSETQPASGAEGGDIVPKLESLEETTSSAPPMYVASVNLEKVVIKRGIPPKPKKTKKASKPVTIASRVKNRYFEQFQAEDAKEAELIFRHSLGETRKAFIERRKEELKESPPERKYRTIIDALREKRKSGDTTDIASLDPSFKQKVAPLPMGPWPGNIVEVRKSDRSNPVVGVVLEYMYVFFFIFFVFFVLAHSHVTLHIAFLTHTHSLSLIPSLALLYL